MLNRSGKPWALPLLLLLSGCAHNLGDDRFTLLWAIPPAGIFGILGMFWVYWHRKDQLAVWDLRTHPVPPEGRWAAWVLYGAAGSAAVAFALLNGLTGNVDGLQKLQNIFAWWMVSTFSVALAVYFGRKLAERGFTRKEN